jgi:hypothetical protein
MRDNHVLQKDEQHTTRAAWQSAGLATQDIIALLEGDRLPIEVEVYGISVLQSEEREQAYPYLARSNKVTPTITQPRQIVYSIL